MIPLKLGVEDLAKYPFLEEAGEYFRQRGFSLNDISQPDFGVVVQRAKLRVMESIRQREVSAKIDDPEVELLSFPVALVLVKATKLDYLLSRYALAEAIRAEKLLENERKDLVIQIFHNVLKIEIVPVLADEDRSRIVDYKIPLEEYVKRAARFRDPKWDVANRIRDEGFVCLKNNDLIRLIRQEIDELVRVRLSALPVPKLPENLEVIVNDLAAKSPPPPKPITFIAPDKYPPCVMAAQKMLEKGENLPHYARFLLTTYLVTAGKTVDELVHMYNVSPDFNERIARYQVEHIAGLRGGRVKYTCPSCQTLLTHNFCFKTNECDDIRNPLQFGRWFKKSGSKRSKEKP